MRKNHLISLLLLICFSFTTVSSQSFGKNKVQYRIFDWSYIQSSNFDIYYYGKGKLLAEFTSEIAEKAYQQISRHLNWTLKRRVSIIVYNSHNDFQQNNVTYDYMPEGVGGVTELFKNRVVLPFEGDYEQFRHVIHHELVHAMVNDMIYGGSYQAAVSNRVRVSIPLWMNEGLAEFLSINWDTETDMIIRDVAVHERIPEIRELNYYMAYKGGQSVWRFIAGKYGRQKIGDIFRKVKRSQDVEKGFEKAIGLKLEELSKQWQKYIKKEYWPDISHHDEIEDFAHKLTDHEELRNYFNISPAISPDGSKIAILTDRKGRADIYLISAIDGKPIKRLIKGNRTPGLEELKWLQPGLSWSPDGNKIVFTAKAGKTDALYILDVKTKNRKKYVFDLDGIFTASWCPKGDKIAFVGNKGSASDIYVYNIISGSLDNLTDDIFSDSEPVWSPDGEFIAFVSDRKNNITVSDDFKMYEHDFQQEDIFILNPETREIKRITNTSYKENYPVWAHTSNSLIYTADQNGIWNLHIYDLDNGSTRVISDVMTGIFQLSLSWDDQKLIFSGYSNTGWDIYTLNNPLDYPDRKIAETKFHKQKGETKPDEFLLTDSGIGEHPKISYKKDAYSRYIFAPQYERYNPDLVDTTAAESSKPLALSEYKNQDGTYRSHPYKTRFTLDLVQGQASFSNVFGYMGTTLFAFSDILGDHRIFLGTELVINLENSDYFFQYDYLKRHNDYSFSLYHTANFFGYDYDFVRLRHYSMNFLVSHPLNRFHRFDFGITDHFINYRQFVLQSGLEDYDIVDNRSIQSYTYHISWVYDNSSWGYTAPDDGWRSNITFLQSPKLGGNGGLEFTTVMMDARRYFRASQDYNFALRLMAGTSFGPDAQKFFLGGVENWIIGTGETNGEPDRSRINEDEFEIFNEENTDFLKNLYFSIFALPVRGSRFIERFGTNLVLTNFEFRFPFVNYMALGFPLKIILGNIRGIAFIDIGAAWDDTLHLTKTLYNGKKEFDDLIAGYGIGVRINFGYFILRIDTAWDLLLQRSSKPQYYLSLGTDL